MKRKIFGFFLFLILFVTFLLNIEIAHASDNELSLFDSNGRPVAYIRYDRDNVIYMWDGEPVAYLYEDYSGSRHVYRFDGTHIGWFRHGILWDENGFAVGFIKGAVNMVTMFEPFKSFRQFPPIKGIRESAPQEPEFLDQWSSMPLAVFLRYDESEPVLLARDYNGNQVYIVRANGDIVSLSAKVWCSWSWRYEGKIIWAEIGLVSTELITEEGEISSFWTKEIIPNY